MIPRLHPHSSIIGRTVLLRTGKEKEGKHPAKLMALVGIEYVNWIDYFFKKDKLIAYYTFAKLFEQSHLSGGSGVHVHIIDITIDRNLMEMFNRKTYPTSATLNISLDEYDEMRKAPRVWRTLGKMKAPLDYPEYKRLT